MLKLINEDHGTDSTVREVLGAIESLKESLPEIYDHLISLTSLLKDENIEQFKKPGQVKDIAEVTANNAEEKNSFALSVLRRIKMKLDGREPDVLRKATGKTSYMEYSLVHIKRIPYSSFIPYQRFHFWDIIL